MYVCKSDVCPYQGGAMAVCDTNPGLAATGLEPLSVPVTAASCAPASPLGWPSWGGADIPRHGHCLQTIALCTYGGGGDGGWIGRQPSTETPLPWQSRQRMQQLFCATVHPTLLLRFFLCQTNMTLQI